MTVRLLTPLPARVRLRLHAAQCIDRVGAWLCGHGHTRAAERMWRACRMI